MIRIVTDSACDLPTSLLDERRISVVPLSVRFGGQEFVDRSGLTSDAFWDRLTGEGPHPSTAAPPIGRFTETFDRLADGGATGILVITMSSAISATWRSAQLAAEDYRRVPVRVVDSRLVAGALGLAVLAAADAAETGGTLDSVAAVAETAASQCGLFVALDTLEYLRRGGRIGRAAAFFGSLLDVKPLITFEEGEVAAAGRVRTRRKAVDAVIDHLGEVDRPAQVAVIHSGPPDLEAFVARVSAIVGGEVVMARLGPVVGTHAGPNAIGVAYRAGSIGAPPAGE